MFNATSSALLNHSSLNHSPQIEGANFLNLLIVDDDLAVREACRDVAQSLGFNTRMAESAEQAYRLLDAANTDAVLLDLRMPGAGGLDALHTIRKTTRRCAGNRRYRLWHGEVSRAGDEGWCL